MTAERSVSIVRVYGDVGRTGDEYRVLVDRLWPRGRPRGVVDADEWAKDVAPTTGLRQWYAHDVARFDEFARRYLDELAGTTQCAIVRRLRSTRRVRDVVLLTASRDVEHSNAEVLRRIIVDASPSVTSRAQRPRVP